SASIGTILAQGLPFMSTNMAKKNSTPSDSALARSSPATSDMGTSRLTRGGCWLAAGRDAGSADDSQGGSPNLPGAALAAPDTHERGRCSPGCNDAESVGRARGVWEDACGPRATLVPGWYPRRPARGNRAVAVVTRQVGTAPGAAPRPVVFTVAQRRVLTVNMPATIRRPRPGLPAGPARPGGPP